MTAGTDFKKYVLVFFLTVSGFLALLLSASFYFQPLEGELTRLGSYAERDFGWNLPQKKIRGDANLVPAYDGKSDVLILGDSFSTNGVWQPFFGQMTGFTYETVNRRLTALHEVMESEEFRKKPPKVMVVECAERELFFILDDMNLRCSSHHQRRLSVLLRTHNNDAHPEYIVEMRKRFDISKLNLRYTSLVLFHSFIRELFGADFGVVKRFNLANRNLFSNRKNDQILVYEGDLYKLLWRNEDLEKAVCAIRGLQDKIESSGKTLFVFMFAPDKATAYADYIKDPMFRSALNTQRHLLKRGVHSPGIERLLKREIDRGVKDIYNPNGTHWSAYGYQIAAEGVADFIKNHSHGEP